MVSETNRAAGISSGNTNTLTFRVVRNLLTIYVILVFLGFPGTLSKVIGSGPAKLLETASFGLQFMLIMLASGEDVMSMKLVNINYAYWLIYSFVLYIVLDSLVVSIDRKMVLISAIHLALTVLFALWLIEQYDMEEMLELFYGALTIFVSILLIGVVLFPKVVFFNYQGSKTFCGLFATKNEAGTVLCLGIILQTVLLEMRLRKKKKITLLFLGLLLAQFGLLMLTKNMGSILVSFVAIGYIIFYALQKKKKRLPICLLFVAASVGFLFFALTVLKALGPFFESLGKDASLTGRVPLWEQAINVMSNNHTLTGYGYLMFWRTPSIVNVFHSGFEENTWAAVYSASMHNMIIELWCDLGLMGVGLLFLMMLGADQGVKYLGEEQYMFSSAYIVMYTVSNLTERGMLADSLFTLVLFVVLGMMYQAKFRAKADRMKKARIYKDETAAPVIETKEEEDMPDWYAFQKKCSSQFTGFTMNVSQQPQEDRTDNENNEEESELDAFFKGLYDDDKS